MNSRNDFESAKNSMEVVYELSRLLNTGLEKDTLSILVSLIEEGVNPEALGMVVRELRREKSNLDLESHEVESSEG